jgi:hypothetical protein
MNTPLALLDFFDSREKAVALWGAAILTYAAVKGEGVAPSMVQVVRSLLAPKLLLLFGSAAVYCAALVFVADWLGFWHTTAVKETSYWFITGGAVLAGRGVGHAAPFDRAFYLKLIRHAIRFTIVVEFLINLYVFPFLAELVLVPFIVLFVGMQVVAAYDDSVKAARKPIDVVLITMSLFLLIHAAVEAIADPGALFTRENLESVLIAPALTFAFIPFLAAWAWISRRELDNVRKQVWADYESSA